MWRGARTRRAGDRRRGVASSARAIQRRPPESRTQGMDRPRARADLAPHEIAHAVLTRRTTGVSCGLGEADRRYNVRETGRATTTRAAGNRGAVEYPRRVPGHDEWEYSATGGGRSHAAGDRGGLAPPVAQDLDRAGGLRSDTSRAACARGPHGGGTSSEATGTISEPGCGAGDRVSRYGMDGRAGAEGSRRSRRRRRSPRGRTGGARRDARSLPRRSAKKRRGRRPRHYTITTRAPSGGAREDADQWSAAPRSPIESANRAARAANARVLRRPRVSAERHQSRPYARRGCSQLPARLETARVRDEPRGMGPASRSRLPPRSVEPPPPPSAPGLASALANSGTKGVVSAATAQAQSASAAGGRRTRARRGFPRVPPRSPRSRAADDVALSRRQRCRQAPASRRRDVPRAAMVGRDVVRWPRAEPRRGVEQHEFPALGRGDHHERAGPPTSPPESSESVRARVARRRPLQRASGTGVVLLRKVDVIGDEASRARTASRSCPIRRDRTPRAERRPLVHGARPRVHRSATASA